MTPGWEGAGTVVEVGDGMFAKPLKGKRVSFCKGQDFMIGGSMAEYILTDATACIQMPDTMTEEQGATCFVNPLSAVGLVDRAKALGAKSLIMTAAAS